MHVSARRSACNFLLKKVSAQFPYCWCLGSASGSTYQVQPDLVEYRVQQKVIAAEENLSNIVLEVFGSRTVDSRRAHHAAGDMARWIVSLVCHIAAW